MLHSVGIIFCTLLVESEFGVRIKKPLRPPPLTQVDYFDPAGRKFAEIALNKPLKIVIKWDSGKSLHVTLFEVEEIQQEVFWSFLVLENP